MFFLCLLLACLALARTHLVSPITSLSVDFKDSDLVQHFFFDTIEIKLGFAIDSHVTQFIQTGDYFDFEVKGSLHIQTDYLYVFDILDSAGILPVFHVTGRPSQHGFAFKARATDYFKNNKQPLDGEIVIEVVASAAPFLSEEIFHFSVNEHTDNLLLKSHYHSDYLSTFSLSPDLSQIYFNAPVEEGATHTFVLTVGDGLSFEATSLTARYFDEDRFWTAKAVKVQETALLTPSSLSVTIIDVLGDPVYLVRFEQDLEEPKSNQTLFCASVEQDGHVIIDKCISTGSGVDRVPGGSGSLLEKTMAFHKQL